MPREDRRTRRDLLRLGVISAAVTLGAAPVENRKGDLLYESRMDSRSSVTGWVMEGPGKVDFAGGWMRMHSPGEKMHHVYWCPKAFPASFVAEWEAQNLHPEAGLCIVFFAATGLNGEDVMDPSLPKRDGTFAQYNNGQLSNYHISYYANTPQAPDREVTRLRKNPGRHIVQEAPIAIPAASTAVHKIRLVKDGPHVLFFAGARKIIDWTDAGKVQGAAYGAGKIAFRQMQWTVFRYRNFKVWALKPET